MQYIAFSWPNIVCVHVLVLILHILIILSSLHEIMNSLSLEKIADLTEFRCPLKVAIHFLLSKSHSFISLSALAVTIYLPFEENYAYQTCYLWSERE